MYTNAGFKKLRTLTHIIVEAIFSVAFAETSIVPECEWNRTIKGVQILKTVILSPPKGRIRNRVTLILKLSTRCAGYFSPGKRALLSQ